MKHGLERRQIQGGNAVKKLMLAVVLLALAVPGLGWAESHPASERVSFTVAPHYVWNSEAANPGAKVPARNPNELALAGTLGYDINGNAAVQLSISRGLDSKLTRVTAGVSWKL